MPPPKCTLNLLTSHMSPQCVTDYSPVSAGHLGVTSPFSSTFSSSPWTSLQGFSTDWPVKEPGSPTIKLVPKTYEDYLTTKNCSPATSPPHWYSDYKDIAGVSFFFWGIWLCHFLPFPAIWQQKIFPEQNSWLFNSDIRGSISELLQLHENDLSFSLSLLDFLVK